MAVALEMAIRGDSSDGRRQPVTDSPFRFDRYGAASGTAGLVAARPATLVASLGCIGLEAALRCRFWLLSDAAVDSWGWRRAEAFFLVDVEGETHFRRRSRPTINGDTTNKVAGVSRDTHLSTSRRRVANYHAGRWWFEGRPAEPWRSECRVRGQNQPRWRSQ